MVSFAGGQVKPRQGQGRPDPRRRSGFQYRSLLRSKPFQTTVAALVILAFFGAMAVLPLFGFPLSAFTLVAGPVFGPVFSVLGPKF